MGMVELNVSSLLIGVPIMLAIGLASFIPGVIVALLTRRKEVRARAAVLTICIVAGFPMLFLLAGWTITDCESLVSAVPIPATFVLITFFASILLARWRVTTYWWQALLIALAGLIGHLVIGWPTAYLPLKDPNHPGSIIGPWEAARAHRYSQAKARPLLKSYGLKLPSQYRVIETYIPWGSFSLGEREYDGEAYISVEPRPKPFLLHKEAHSAYSDLSAAPLKSWLLSSGYKLFSSNDDKSFSYTPRHSSWYAKGGLIIGVEELNLSGGLFVREWHGFGLSLAKGMSALAARQELGPDSTGKPLRELDGSAESVEQIVFSPDGLTLASCSDHGTVCVWQLAEGSLSPAVVQHSCRVNAIAFSPDGTKLAAGCVDGSVSLWNPADSQAQPVVLTDCGGVTLGYRVTAIAFSPDGVKLAAGCSDGTVSLLCPADPQAQPEILTERGGFYWTVRCMVISPDGRWLFVGGTDENIRLWDLTNIKLTPALLTGRVLWEGGGGGVFSPDSKLLATWGDDRIVRLWNPQQPQKELRIFTDKTAKGPVFSQDGRLLVVGSDQGVIRIWNLRQPQASAVELTESEGFYPLAITPDGRKLISSDFDYNRIIVWDLRQRPPAPIRLEELQFNVLAVAVSPDGKQLASGTEDGRIQLRSLYQ